MQLRNLRRQLLLAMGLPITFGCGASPPPGGGGSGDGSGTDRIMIGGGGGGGEIGNEVQPWTAGEACPSDYLPETICGGAVNPDGTANCQGNGGNLTSYGNSQIWVSQGNYGANDQAWATFQFDQEATDRYRTSLARENLPLEQYCCFSQCTPLRVASSAPTDVPDGYITTSTCIPPPPSGTSQPSSEAPECPAAVQLQGEMRPLQHGGYGQCCYTVLVPEPEEQHHYRGRPARVDGVAKLPDTAATHAWSAGPRVDTALPDDVRAQLAAAWTAAARLEHASIASFAGLALELLAAGAPPALVEAAHAAALDEIAHARVAFGLASAYAGGPVGPAAFPAARQLGGGDLAALAIACAVDGCVGETVAAVEAARAADAATDPAVASALRTIAVDEARHAELAWAIVAWAVRARPELAPAVQRALADAAAPAPSAPEGDDLSAHGVLPAHTLVALRDEVIREVVAPCARALALG